MKRIFALLILAVILTFSACGKTETAQQDTGKIKVYASFYAMYDFARMIGADKAEVVCMVPAGVEPHDWEPSPSDIAGLEKADVFVYSGSNMEHWIDSVLPTLSNKELKKVSLEGSSFIQSDSDPHLWLSPKIAGEYMRVIKDALSEKDPDNAAYYNENYEICKSRITDLQEKIKTVSAGFVSKEIVVSHGAYGYLCKICGITQIAIEGMAGESDPSPAKMAEIAKQIKEKNIKYIFTEPGESSKTIDTLAAETGAQVMELDPFEFGGNGRDYFLVMEENLAALEKALG